MSGHNRNEAQNAAVYANNKRILVSAGAGTGKSTTMTDRIMRILLEQRATLDQMLIITFTREAAGAIRKKIRDALTDLSLKDKSDIAATNLSLLPAASISTIHAFCGRVVRDGAIQLDISPDYQVIDDDVRHTLFTQAVNDAFDEIGKPTYPRDLRSRIMAFKRSVKAANVVDVCEAAYEVLMGIPNPFDRISEIVNVMDAQDNPWKRELFAHHKQMLLSKRVFVERMKNIAADNAFPLSVLDIIKSDIGVVEKFIKDIENAKSINELIKACMTVAENISNKNKPKDLTDQEAALYEEYKTIRGYFRNKTAKGNARNLVMYSATILSTICGNAQDMTRIKNQAQGLVLLLQEIHNQFRAIKTGSEAQASMLDYSDLEQYCYQLLTDTNDAGIREAKQSQFKYVFVDECQDVSAIQHAIIDALGTPDNSLFYVGDIKQSIYRFRHADPLTFLRMRDEYQDNESAEKRKIYFRHNYRSSETVINCVNAVFEMLLDRSMTEIDYEQGDELIKANDKITKASPTEIYVVNNSIDRDPVTDQPVTDSLQAQCRVVGDRIAELIKEGYDYKDIVILLRGAKTSAPTIKDWLGIMHIPCYYGGKQNYFQVPEVAAIIDILRVINNEYQDYPLISVLRNMPFNFTDTELAAIRLSQNDYSSYSDAFHGLAEKNSTALEKKCHDALEQIHAWQIQAEVSKPSAMIWRIIKDFGIYALHGAMPDGEMRQKNLYALHQKAVDFEAIGNYSIGDYLESIEKLEKAGGGGEDATPMGEKDNFVRIMTIHASKGLEFPVVILMDAQKDIHRKNDSRVLINIESKNNINESLGIYMPYANIGRNIRRDNYGLHAFSARQFMMELAEESRMLYVAMTRAETKLIIVGSVNPGKMDNWYEKDKTYRLINTRSMLDMIMPAALNGITIRDEGEIVNNDLWKVWFVHAMSVEEKSSRQNHTKALGIGTNHADFDSIWSRVRKDRTNLPAKTAVTSLVNHTFKPEDEDQPEQVIQFQLADSMEMPSFMTDGGDVDYAEVGTITHHFLSEMDIERIRNSINDGESALNTISSEYELVNLNVYKKRQEEEIVRKKMLPGVARFVEGRIGQQMITAETLLREKAFVYSVSIDSHTILVQGVVDAMYLNENGNWIIIDYKTDSDASEEVIREKHSMQLNYYRSAIERITRIPVEKMYVVAIRTGEAVEIERNETEYA